jgi:hypothetical protein
MLHIKLMFNPNDPLTIIYRKAHPQTSPRHSGLLDSACKFLDQTYNLAMFMP